jgi:hypothetical protein
MRDRQGVVPPLGLPEGESQECGTRGKQRRVAGKDKFAGPVGKGRGQCEVGTDAGGFAGRDDEAFRAQGFRIST